MISKIITLARPLVLGDIFAIEQDMAIQTSFGAREYFDIGLPVNIPVSPVGTIAVILENSFIERNRTAFLWASIPDNGGVKYGFFDHIPSCQYKSLRLNYNDFLEILHCIEALPSACRDDVLAKRSSVSFVKSIRSLVAENVIEGMLSHPMQTSRRIEFCLEGKLAFENEDIRSVFIPNTYRSFLRRNLAKFSCSKIVYYNPKYSVTECLERDGTSCYWRV